VIAITSLLLLCLYESESKIEVRGSSDSVRRNTKLTHGSLPLLPQSQIDEVDKFLFFIGYPRSGHSIVGACLDAHPDVIVAHEYNLFPKMLPSTGSGKKLHDQLLNKTFLYNTLYQNSVKASRDGWRSSKRDGKGYTLHFGSAKSWQGKIRTLKVIGDKSGGVTARAIRDSPEQFDKVFQELKQTVRVPFKVIHVVRNPYDMVATRLLYRLSTKKGRKANFSASHKVSDHKTVFSAIKGMRSEASAVNKFIKQYPSITFEMHNVDYIYKTRLTLLEMCSFLELECSDEFIQMCQDKAAKRPSNTREVVNWDSQLRNSMLKLTSDFTFFQRYSLKPDWH